LIFFDIALVALVLLASISIVWTTLSAGMSPMPSSKKARDAMIQLLESAGEESGVETEAWPVVDLGSGWGSLIIRLAIKYPKRQIVGYELSFLPWLVTLIIRKLLGLKNLTIYRQDFLKADLSASSLMVCYLFPAGMTALETKLSTEETTARYLISNNFALPTLTAEKSIHLNDFYKSPVFRYRLG